MVYTPMEEHGQPYGYLLSLPVPQSFKKDLKTTNPLVRHAKTLLAYVGID
jgi:hypothetical protein